jgi:hypothetical protein
MCYTRALSFSLLLILSAISSLCRALYTFRTFSRGTALKKQMFVYSAEYNIYCQLQVNSHRGGHGGSALVLLRCFEPRQSSLQVKSKYQA